MKAFNPFNQSAAGEYFVGRETAVQTFHGLLYSVIDGSPNHMFIAGLHGTGKTSFLKHASHLAPELGIAVAFLTLTESATAEDHIKQIAGEIVRTTQAALEEAASDSSPQLVNEWERGDESSFAVPRMANLSTDALHRDIQRLESHLKSQAVRGVLVCIDEAQRIQPAALSVLKNTFQHSHLFLFALSLRIVSDAHGPISEGKTLLEEKAREAEGDYGASAFFSSGIGIGPFESPEEADECIKRRLKSNEISFGESVTRRIGEIERFVPRAMLLLANSVYNATKTSGEKTATMNHFTEAFREMYPSECKAAVAIVDTLTAEGRKCLHALVMLRKAARPQDLVSYIYPHVPEETLPALRDAFRGYLEEVSSNSRFCEQANGGGDTFLIPNPVRSFALELLLN